MGLSGQKELDIALTLVAGKMKDLRPAWEEIEQLMISLQKKVFKSKGSAEGLKKWEDLKPRTIAQKKKINSRWAIFPLIRTERLMNAWISKTGTKDSVRIKQPLFFAYGIDENEITYAAHHQWGAPKANIPKREILRIPLVFRKKIPNIITKHLLSTGQAERKTIFDRVGVDR